MPEGMVAQISRDAVKFNRIANDPSVLPWVAQKGVERLDFTAFFDEPRNIGFHYGDCCFVAHWLEPGVYEVHSMALPSARGRTVLDAARASIAHMFMAEPAMELCTRVVAGNVAADALTRRMGFAYEFERSGVWDGKDVRFYALRYPEWVKRQDWLKLSGEWFHSALGDDKTHVDDSAHDLYVGACVEMVRAGQPDKAIALYNRWARFAGYEPVEIVSRSPIVIDIRSHFIRVLDDGKVEVV